MFFFGKNCRPNKANGFHAGRQFSILPIIAFQKQKAMKYFSIFFFPCFLFLTSCGDDDGFSAEGVPDIEEYLVENSLTAQSTSSGLHYIIEEEGTGGNPTLSDEVTVFYKGYYLDGKTFDQTGADPISFPLQNVILGWQEGIPLFQKGGKGILLIPPELGYGSTPPSGIRKNAVLVFEVELVDF